MVDAERYGEEDLLAAIDAGADDVIADGDLLKVTTAPSALTAVRGALEQSGIEIESAELTMEPNSIVEVEGEADARALVKLMETLDDHDDVEAVHANFDIPEALLDRATA